MSQFFPVFSGYSYSTGIVNIQIFISVRQKTKELIDFIQDDERLREDRKKAKKNKDKYVGMSNDTSAYRYSKYTSLHSVNRWLFT